MEISTLLQKHPHLQNSVDKTCVNPLRVAEDYYFGRHSLMKDYREEAIKFCSKNDLSFTSTCNSFFNLMKKFVKVTCPRCKKANMTVEGGGGSGSSSTVHYTCRCGASVNLTMDPEEGFNVRMPVK